ncbi:MAG: hypothetical protein PHF86_08845 [Candidatus Nanoarchaeia archaeon]|nr:hypothetical protein [Candidatus Nanoarchaeia archaeon]
MKEVKHLIDEKGMKNLLAVKIAHYQKNPDPKLKVVIENFMKMCARHNVNISQEERMFREIM